MKKLFFITLMSVAVFSFAACGKTTEGIVPGQPGQEQSGYDLPEQGGNHRYLVLYCSRTSNTERVARHLSSTLDCDILEVVPDLPYDEDYNAMLGRAQDELAAIREGNYPEVSTDMDNFDGYEIMFVGYPIWYGSMAVPMQTFLHNHASKLEGKRIALFATSGSSGMDLSVREAVALCPGSEVLEQPLLLTSATLPQMERRVADWLDDMGVTGDMPEVSELGMNIIVGGRTITATMEDNAAARDWLSRLPIDVTLNDYNNITDKIFYPRPEFDLTDVRRGCAPVAGDITVYEPWGNVTIFCKDWPQSSSLIKIGHIDGNGIEALAVPGDVRVRFERR